MRLVRDVRVNTELYTALLNNTQQLKLIRAGKVGNVRILDAAVQPDKPVRPKAAIIILVASAIGLIIGLLSALVRNALFGGLSEPEEVERYTGLPVLAAIPYSDIQDKLWRRSRRKNATVDAGAEPEQRAAHRKPAGLPQCAGLAAPVGQQHGHVHRPRGRVGKSFLSANFAFIQGGVGKRVLLIDADFRKGQLNRYFGVPRRTACQQHGQPPAPWPGGKSFLSANFAFIQGGVGKRVLLIDADFRKGQLNRYFGVPKEDGLFEVLSGTIPLEQVRRHSVSEGVDFISTGAVTFDPSELLASPVFGQTLRELSTQYDMVVLDTAPVLSSPDAAVVGSHAAAVMVVVRSGMNTVGEIRETAKRLIRPARRWTACCSTA